MANKIYTVVKDGEELEKLKTLAAAKKLADAEGAEIRPSGWRSSPAAFPAST